MASSLLDAVDRQFAHGMVAFEVHLSGGKLKSAFTHYRCVHGDWVPHDTWTVETDDQRDLAIGKIELPENPSTVEELATQLGIFIAAVNRLEGHPTRSVNDTGT